MIVDDLKISIKPVLTYSTQLYKTVVCNWVTHDPIIKTFTDVLNAKSN